MKTNEKLSFPLTNEFVSYTKYKGWTNNKYFYIQVELNFVSYGILK